MKYMKKSIKISLAAFLMSSSLYATDCAYEVFNISSTKNTKIVDFIEQLSDECQLSLIVKDPKADEFLQKTLNKTNFNNLTLNEILDIILKENNLSYTLENNLLRVSYLETKMYNIDYILSQRKSKGSTDVTLSSEGAGVARSNNMQSMGRMQNDQNSLAQGGGSAGKSGIKIESEDEVQFWHDLDLEFQKVLNRPEDLYEAQPPIINKNAGMITVTATGKQLERFDTYLKNLQERVKLQVLIDVQLLSVTMNKDQTTGVDWSQLYKLQNIDIGIDYLSKKNLLNFSSDEAKIVGSTTFGVLGSSPDNNAHAFQVSGKGSLNEVIKFLKTQGDVHSISNPKVLTLNNQPAIISAGTEYFYKITSTETLAGGNTGTTSENEDVQSVFAGVLLDITPEISSDNSITLKINPSLSETAYDISNVLSEDRTMPPDLKRRQLSSVVTVQNGNRVILGGLINTNTYIDSNKVPILGDIPVLNYLFKYESKQKQVQELVIIIQPTIIDKNKKDLSLADFGYQGISDNVLKSAKDAATEMTREPN